MGLRAVLLTTFVLGSTALSAAAGPGMIGWRHDNSGIFPADCKPVAEWDLANGKNIAWRTPLPNHGNGSPIAVGKQVFVVVEPGAEGIDTPILMCFDGDSGKELWRQPVDPFTALPAGDRQQLAALRSLYWQNMRKVNRLWNRSLGGDAKAIDELIAAFPQSNNNKFRKGLQGGIKDKSPSKLMALPFGAKKTELATTMAPLRGHNFQVPSWNWTGMGITMATPVSDGRHIYVVTGWRTVSAYTLDGTQVWHHYLQNIKPRSYWVESLGNSPLIVDGKLVVCFFDHLLCFDPSSGKELWRIKTRTFEGHGMGTPAVVRIPLAGGPETVTAIFCMGGELVRLDDGHVYARDIGMFDACVSTKSNGKDVIYATNGGSGGAWRGTKKEYADRRFIDHKGGMAIRFGLKDRETLTAERLWTNAGVGGIAIVMDDKIYTGKSIIDANSGQPLTDKNYGMRYYNGNIFAGGLFIGNTDAAPHPNPRKRKSDFATFTTQVYRMGAFGRAGITNRLNQVPDSTAGDDHRQLVIDISGVFGGRQWYGWHSSYSTPFASGNRLFIRTYEYLYSIGDKGQGFKPSKAFMPR